MLEEHTQNPYQNSFSSKNRKNGIIFVGVVRGCLWRYATSRVLLFFVSWFFGKEICGIICFHILVLKLLTAAQQNKAEKQNIPHSTVQTTEITPKQLHPSQDDGVTQLGTCFALIINGRFRLFFPLGQFQSTFTGKNPKEGWIFESVITLDRERFFFLSMWRFGVWGLSPSTWCFRGLHEKAWCYKDLVWSCLVGDFSMD